MKSFIKTLFSFNFTRFFAVGLLNTTIDLLVFNIVLVLLSVTPFWLLVAIAKTIGFLIATVNSYICNRAWTFARQKNETHVLSTGKQLIRFSVASVFGLLVNVAATSLSLYVFITLNIFDSNLNANLAFLVGTFFTMIWNFTAYKYFVFMKQ